jgi:KaiC/GvpD/RAD55 family RecA-like ATPase
MPGPGELPAQQPGLIIGREAALARLHGLVNPALQASQVLVVTGEAGMGKTMLLADTVARARLADLRVLSVTGRESESRLASEGRVHRPPAGRRAPCTRALVRDQVRQGEFAAQDGSMSWL